MHWWNRHLNIFQKHFGLSLQDSHLLELDMLIFQSTPLLQLWRSLAQAQGLPRARIGHRPCHDSTASLAGRGTNSLALGLK